MSHDITNCDKVEKTAIIDKAFSIITLVISTAFYLYFALIDGPVWCVDSNSYTTMDFSREPAYPTFLLLLRCIFGEAERRNSLPNYLQYAVIIQSLIWSYMTFRACKFVFDIYFFQSDQKCSKRRNFEPILFGILTFGMMIAVPILDRFFVERHSMYSESIMTESLAMPIFVIFLIRLCEWYLYEKEKDFVLLFVEALLLINIRKQMMVVILVWAATSFLYNVVRKSTRDIKLFLITLVTIAVTIVSAKLIDSTYNYFVRGEFTEHVGNHNGAFCTLMYSAGEEDIALFEDEGAFPGEQELFTKIYEECSKRELLLENAEKNISWPELTSHYADNYDLIGYEVITPFCTEYIKENNPNLDYNHRRMLEDELEADMVKKLFKQDKGDLIKVFLANLARAFVYSNARMMPRILIAVSFAIYVIYIINYIMTSKHQSISTTCNTRKKALILSEITFIALAVNAVSVGILIFPQGRYMTYATGLFFTCFCILMYENIKRPVTSH